MTDIPIKTEEEEDEKKKLEEEKIKLGKYGSIFSIKNLKMNLDVIPLRMKVFN